MAPKSKTKKRTKPPFQPTDFQRGEVRAAVRFGQTQDDIAAELGVDPKTLRKYFADELDFGKARLLRRIHNGLVQRFLGAPAQYDDKGRLVREEIKPDASPASGIFLLKTQGKKYGFVEGFEHTGKDGVPLIPEEKLKGLNDEQLRILEAARSIVAGLVGSTGS